MRRKPDESPALSSARQADRELYDARGKRVEVTDERLVVEFTDGRIISVPLKWYPRLVHATPDERRRAKIGALGLHWPDLDEDISYRGLLLGRRDRSNPRFLRFWLRNRRQGRSVTFEDWMKARRRRPTAGKPQGTRRGKQQ